MVSHAIITGPEQHNISSRNLDVEFQSGTKTTSVVVGIVDNDVYGSDFSTMHFRLVTLNDVFVTIGRNKFLRIILYDDEIYTVKIVSFTDFVTEGNDAAAVLVLEFQEPPGGSISTPRFSTRVRAVGGSARGKLKNTSHSNSNVLSSFLKFTPFQLTVTIDHQMS